MGSARRIREVNGRYFLLCRHSTAPPPALPLVFAFLGMQRWPGGLRRTRRCPRRRGPDAGGAHNPLMDMGYFKVGPWISCTILMVRPGLCLRASFLRISSLTESGLVSPAAAAAAAAMLQRAGGVGKGSSAV